MRRQWIIEGALAACAGIAVLATARLSADDEPKAATKGGGGQEVAPVDPKAEKARTARALAVARDGSVSVEARVKAVREIGFVADDPEGVRTLQGIVGDPKQDNALRLAAVQALPVYDQPAAIDALAAVVEDPKAGADLKIAAIEKLQAAASFTPAGRQGQPRILKALRGALADPRVTVRRQAMEYLALINDEAAVGLLKGILAANQEPSSKFTKAEAVRYLALEDPRKHFEAIRPALAASEPEARAAAVTALGSDPASRPRITELLNARNQPTQVKAAALQCLAAYDPQFPTYVSKYFQDKGLDPEVRSAAIEALGRAMNSSKVAVPRAQALTEQIRGILKDAPDSVKKSAQQFLELRAPAPYLAPPEPKK